MSLLTGGYRLMTFIYIEMAIRLIIKVLPNYERRRLVETRNRINRRFWRKFVKYRKVITVRPFQCIEMDIKMDLILS
jgi:hypothetical protein